MMDERAGTTIMPIEDVRQTAEWAKGHPVLGPAARAALFWHDEAERAKATAAAWQERAIALGWTPEQENGSTP